MVRLYLRVEVCLNVHICTKSELNKTGIEKIKKKQLDGISFSDLDTSLVLTCTLSITKHVGKNW